MTPIPQTDSIPTIETAGTEESAATAAPVHRHAITPAEAQRYLPADASAEERDSIVQALCRPAPVTAWSEQPDTLHLPGLPVDFNWREVHLPLYYRESYFTGKPYFHPDLFGGRPGTAGDPVPYSIARDNIITLLLVCCFVLAAIAFSKSRRFMARQMREFFRPPRRKGVTEMTETSGEFRFQFFLILQTCLLEGLIYFLHIEEHFTDTFTVDQYRVIGLYALAFAGYTVAKLAAYWGAGLVFFDRKSTTHWLKSAIFLMATQGVVLYPLVILQAYFGASATVTLTGAVGVLAAFKILAFYKTYAIFFRNGRRYLQNILYFCTLEIMPLLTLWGVLTTMSSYLKVNF